MIRQLVGNGGYGGNIADAQSREQSAVQIFRQMIGLTGQQFQKVGQAAAAAAQMRQNQRQGHGQQAGGRRFGNPALPCQFGSRIGGVTVKHDRQQAVAQINQAF